MKIVGEDNCIYLLGLLDLAMIIRRKNDGRVSF